MNEREVQATNSKEKIINVAIEEFALNGYKAASTNSICKSAKISKGLLYHYYSSKEILYLNALQYSFDKFKQNVTIKIEDSNKKGIEYISEYFNTKFKFFRANPLYSKIITNSLLNDNVESVKSIINEFEEYNNNFIYHVIKNIDINPKFDKEKAFELIIMIGEKLEEKYMRNIESKDKDIAIEQFRKDHKIMIEMVFEGIDK
ncbi:MAG: TetR/AcrR family transcriptional regulator [Romboutsia sp.]|uniref:TetR/AcrR family transcriptional regulator n=1 Tax=Romboutsia sp. TaxID=1965302 RepID=UPI003F3A83FF